MHGPTNIKYQIYYMQNQSFHYGAMIAIFDI